MGVLQLVKILIVRFFSFIKVGIFIVCLPLGIDAASIKYSVDQIGFNGSKMMLRY